jgi:hypothetical protein
MGLALGLEPAIEGNEQLAMSNEQLASRATELPYLLIVHCSLLINNYL